MSANSPLYVCGHCGSSLLIWQERQGNGARKVRCVECSKIDLPSLGYREALTHD